MIEYQEGYHNYYVYIITNKAKTVLYTGVTNNLKIRLQQHKESLNPNSFTAKYNVHFYCISKNSHGYKSQLLKKKKLKDGKKTRKSH